MLSLLSPYLPIDRVCALTRNMSLAVSTSGAALFADISGFTSLTEALVNALGPKRGAEALTHQLNQIYDSLINRVHQLGGSVISFSGDAMTCWFDIAQPQVSGGPEMRAAICGLLMQTDMQAFANVRTPEGLTIALGMKVAIAAGSAQRFIVGDPTIQLIDVLAGDTLQRMVAVEQLAQRGEVLIEASAVSALAAQLRPQQWRQHETIRAGVLPALSFDPAPFFNNATLWTPDQQATTNLNAWILPPILNRLLAGAAHYLAEMRPACVLFMRFEVFADRQDVVAQQQLDQYICWVQQVLVRYDAFVLQLTVGDKGCYLYSAFGAPIAHDDDTERAILAALALQKPPAIFAAMSLPQIGISQGHIYSGAYGGHARKTYGVLGDEVNLAARLMSKAATGQILVSQRVHHALNSQLQRDQGTRAQAYFLNPLGLISVKGKKDALEIWEVRDTTGQAAIALSMLRSRPALPSIFVERQDELRQLKTWYADAEKEGRVVILSGVAGIGKSSLIHHFETQTLGAQTQWVQGGCPSLGQDIVYAPWRDIFQRLLGLTPDGSLAQWMTQLTAQFEAMNPEWQARLPLLGDILALPIPNNQVTATYEPQIRQQALFSLCIDLLTHYTSQRLGRLPLLLVIHDAHRIDEASAHLLQAVARATAHLPLMMLLALRQTAPLAVWLQQVQTLPHTRLLSLPPFDQPQVAKLSAALLQSPCQPELVKFIYERTHGNAFYSRELLNMLREQKGIVYADGVWQLLPIAHAMPLPDSIQGMVLARVDHMPEKPKAILKSASVIGYQFEQLVLATLHEAIQTSDSGQTATLDPIFVSQLALLVHQVFIQPSDKPETLRFRDAVTHEVVYELLLEWQQQQLHRLIGQALEKLNPSLIERLAHHTYLGQDWVRALGYQIQMGEQAKRLFINQRAIDYFERGLRCIEHLDGDRTEQALQLYLHLGELCVATNKYDIAAQHLAHALKWAQQLQQIEAEARACRWFARLYELTGDYAQNLLWFERGLQLVNTQPSPSLALSIEAAELLLQAGMIYLRQGQPQKVADISRLAVAAADKITQLSAEMRTQMPTQDDTHVVATIARTYNFLGNVDLAFGKAAQSLGHFQHSLGLYQTISHVSGQALSLNQLSRAYIAIGRLEASIEPAQQARALFEQLGDYYHCALVDNNLGEVARSLNRPDTAIVAYEKALHTMNQIGASQWVVGALHNNMGAALIQKGEIATARSHLAAAQAIFSQANLRDFLPELWRLQAEASLALGEVDRALHEGSVALGHAQALQQRAEEGSILRVLGEAWLKQGQISQAKALLSLSHAAHHEVGNAAEADRVAALILAVVG